jgi:hypothetical protein
MLYDQFEHVWNSRSTCTQFRRQHATPTCPYVLLCRKTMHPKRPISLMLAVPRPVATNRTMLISTNGATRISTYRKNGPISSNPQIPILSKYTASIHTSSHLQTPFPNHCHQSLPQDSPDRIAPPIASIANTYCSPSAALQTPRLALGFHNLGRRSSSIPQFMAISVV